MSVVDSVRALSFPTCAWRSGSVVLNFEPGRRIIFERYPETLSLRSLRWWSARRSLFLRGFLPYRRGHGADRAVGVFTLFGLAIPIRAGAGLILVFSIELGLLPVSGLGSGYYILPAAKLARRSRRFSHACAVDLRNCQRLRADRSRQGMSMSAVCFGTPFAMR